MEQFKLSEKTIIDLEAEECNTQNLSVKELRQHNALTNSRYDMKANEMDIICQLLSLLQPNDISGTRYQITLKQLEIITGKEWNYLQVKTTAKSLLKKSYEIEDNNTYEGFNWFSSVKYVKDEGLLEIEISENIRPLLLNVKSNYTSFKLKTMFLLKSKFSKRIYQMVCQWKDIGEFTVTIDDLKIKLFLKDPENKIKEQYADYGVFDAYVLSKAKEEINGSTDFKLDYSPIKKGRKVHSVRFTFNAQKLEQLQLDLNYSSSLNESERRLVEDLNKLGIIKKDIVEKILLKQKDAFSWLYKYKLGQIKAKNPAGHLLKSLEIL